MSTAGSAKPPVRHGRGGGSGWVDGIANMIRSLPTGIIRSSTRPVAHVSGGLLVLAVLVSATACGAGRGVGGSGETELVVDPGPTVVEVTNGHWLDVHVYVVASGQRWSLGMVTSQSVRSYELPSGVFASGNDVVLVADPIGSGNTYHSEPVLLEAGDRVEWKLTHRLSHSSLMVF